MFTKKELWNLRKEIVLNSLFINDYINSYGIDPKLVYDFFDGYMDYLSEKARKKDIASILAKDNKNNLYAWYLCFENDPFKR